jgi:hypothetical protein
MQKNYYNTLIATSNVSFFENGKKYIFFGKKAIFLVYKKVDTNY